MQDNKKTKIDNFGFKNQGVNYQKFRPTYPLSFLMQPIKKLKRKHKYVDVASGTGQILFQIASNFQKAEGTDISDKMLSVLSQSAKKYQNLKIYKSSATQISINQKQPYDYITIGQALHFFPIKQSLKHLNKTLQNDGILTVYGYIAQQLCQKFSNSKDNQVFKQFYSIVKPHFEFNRDQLHSHYSDSQRYPFQEVFSKVEKSMLKINSQMSKQACIGYFKTMSGYNHYLRKFPDKEDPIIKVEKELSDKVVMKFDFFRFICHKKINDL